jgi:hypothetical protein
MRKEFGFGGDTLFLDKAIQAFLQAGNFGA